jgi:hypothetical protein
MNRGSTLVAAAGFHAWRWSPSEFWLMGPGLPTNNSLMTSDVIDLAVTLPRVVVLCDSQQGLFVAETTGQIKTHHDVFDAVTRVAVTATTIFIASDAEVIRLGGKMADVVAPDPIDLAAYADGLAVLHDNSITIFDHEGLAPQRIAMRASAIARDDVEPGWLLATDDGIVHLDDHGRATSLSGPIGPGHVVRVRRSRDFLYVERDHLLFELSGSEARQLPFHITWDAAANGLFLEDGGSFSNYFEAERCDCGGRRMQRYLKQGRESDGNTYSIFENTCIACKHTTTSDNRG